jgi:hypothetical protein
MLRPAPGVTPQSAEPRRSVRGINNRCREGPPSLRVSVTVRTIVASLKSLGTTRSRAAGIPIGGDDG